MDPCHVCNDDVAMFEHLENVVHNRKLYDSGPSTEKRAVLLTLFVDEVWNNGGSWGRDIVTMV